MDELNSNIRVFKIGSCWDTKGEPNRKIIEIFKKTNIIFIGNNPKDRKNYIQYAQANVRESDLIVIAEGLNVNAIARVVGKGNYIQYLKSINVDLFPIPKDINSGFDYDFETKINNVFGWEVEIHYPIEDVIKQRGIKVKRERIYKMKKYATDIIDIFNNYSRL